MYYHTPDVKRYVRFMTRYRLGVVAFFVLLTLTLLAFGRFSFVLSDERFWLNGSEELARTEALGVRPEYIQHLRVGVERFDRQSKTKLLALHERLEKQPGVAYVDSLFSRSYIYNDRESGGGSCLLKALPLASLGADKLQAFVSALPDPYRRYTTPDFTHFDFYVYSSARIDASGLDIPFSYSIDEEKSSIRPSEVFGYVLLIAAAIILFFRIIFHNFIAAVAALAVIGMTVVFTFSLIYAVTGLRTLHLALALIIISIALVDYLYFYYRWHVTQYQANSNRALRKTLNRTVTPALWTSIITVIGLGGLLFSESVIVQMLSISIMGASLFAYILNTTLLIALLSFFRVRHPRVVFARPTYYVAVKELSYSPRLLKAFIVTSLAILAVGAFLLIWRSEAIFSPYTGKKNITLSVPFDEIDPETVRRIDAFEQAVRTRFAGVTQIDSIAGVLKLIRQAEDAGSPMDDQSILRGLFFVDMYDLNQRYFNDADGTLSIILHLGAETQTAALVDFIRNYPGLELHFSDMNTLIDNAKQEQTLMLAFSLFLALVFIGLIMGTIFKQVKMIFAGFLVNAIPVAWFGLFVEMLRIPVNLEMLIAMSIAIGLGSDATVHFAFKFFRARYFGRSRKHALEITFFYGAVPVIIGSVVLIAFLASMMLSQIPSLQDIGLYGAVLIFMSLATDLLVLPILLLAIDPFSQERQLHKNYCSF